MRRAWNQISPVLGLALWLLTRSSAAAGDLPTLAHLEYAVHAECPSESDFARQLLERTRRIELVPRERAPWQFAVFVFRQGNGSRGILRVVDAQGQASERSVAAATCSEVVSALALVAALTVDPEASAPAPAVEQTPASTLPSSSQRSLPARAPPPPRLAPRSARPTPERARFVFSAGSELQLEGAVAPDLMPVERLFAEGELESARSALPALRLSAARGRYGYTHARVPVEMTWSSARLEALISWNLAYRLALRPGIFVEYGTLTGEATETDLVEASGRQPRAWGAAGVAGRASWRPAGPLLLELSAAGFAPFFSEDEFTFDDGEDSDPVHAIPRVSGFIGAGIGITTR